MRYRSQDFRWGAPCGRVRTFSARLTGAGNLGIILGSFTRSEVEKFKMYQNGEKLPKMSQMCHFGPRYCPRGGADPWRPGGGARVTPYRFLSQK